MFRPDPEPDHFAAAFDRSAYDVRQERGDYTFDKRRERNVSGGPPAAMGAAPPSLTECERCSYTIAIDDPECGHCGLDREHDVERHRQRAFYGGAQWTPKQKAALEAMRNDLGKFTSEVLTINRLPPSSAWQESMLDSLKRMGGAVTVFGEAQARLGVDLAKGEDFTAVHVKGHFKRYVAPRPEGGDCGCPESRLCDKSCQCDCQDPDNGFVSEGCPLHGDN